MINIKPDRDENFFSRVQAASVLNLQTIPEP